MGIFEGEKYICRDIEPSFQKIQLHFFVFFTKTLAPYPPKNYFNMYEQG